MVDGVAAIPGGACGEGLSKEVIFEWSVNGEKEGPWQHAAGGFSRH